MMWIACVLLAVVLLGGLARLLLYFRGQSGSLPESERLITRQKVLTIAISNIASAGFGFFFLLSGTVGPLGVLVGVLLVVSLMEIMNRSATSGVDTGT